MANFTTAGSDTYPAGIVTQVASDYWQPSSQWAPGTNSVTPLSISFTPKSSGSKLHLFAYFGMTNQTTTPTSRTLFNFYKKRIQRKPPHQRCEIYLPILEE